MSKQVTQLQYLVAYYVRHHLEPQDLNDWPEAAFIGELAERIQDEMPTAELERIRPFLIDGNVNEWIVLGRVIDEMLNPAEDEDDEHDGPDRNWEMRNYFYGSTGIIEGP